MKQGFSLASLFLLVAASALLVSLARYSVLGLEAQGPNAGRVLGSVLWLVAAAALAGGVLGTTAAIYSQGWRRGIVIGLPAGFALGALCGGQLLTRSSFPMVLTGSLLLVLLGLVIRRTHRTLADSPSDPPPSAWDEALRRPVSAPHACFQLAPSRRLERIAARFIPRSPR